MIWLSLVYAKTHQVPSDGTLQQALADPEVDEIIIQGELVHEETIAIDRDLTIKGNDAVTLPPIGVFNNAHVSLERVSIVGSTTDYETYSGEQFTCLDGQKPCTLTAESGSLSLDNVTLDDAKGVYALHARDTDVVIRSSTISNHEATDDYSVLVEATSTAITVAVNDLTFRGNAGPFKILAHPTEDAFVNATVENSLFQDNLGDAPDATDLYLWGVTTTTITSTVFGLSDNHADKSALRLEDSSGTLSDLDFIGDTEQGGGLWLVQQNLPVDVSIEGMGCDQTVMTNGGCLVSENVDNLYVNALEVTDTRATEDGGAVALYNTGATFEAGDIQRSTATTGGGIFQRGGNLDMTALRLCRTDADTGAALYSDNGFVNLSFSAIQRPGTGGAIFVQDGTFQATNITTIAGDDDVFNGTNATVLFDNSIFYGERAFQLASGSADLRYNLFSAGAQVEVEHSDGLLEGDPGFVDADPSDCTAELIPATDSPAVDGNPTETEVDGSGIRDLGWHWGQESTGPSDPTSEGSDAQTGFTVGPASGGCGHAPLAPIALLGIVLAATRRRC